MYDDYVSNHFFEFLDDDFKNVPITKRSFIPIYIIKKIINWGYKLQQRKRENRMESIKDVDISEDDSDSEREEVAIYNLSLMKYKLKEYYNNTKLFSEQKPFTTNDTEEKQEIIICTTPISNDSDFEIMDIVSNTIMDNDSGIVFLCMFRFCVM